LRRDLHQAEKEGIVVEGKERGVKAGEDALRVPRRTLVMWVCATARPVINEAIRRPAASSGFGQTRLRLQLYGTWHHSRLSSHAHGCLDHDIRNNICSACCSCHVCIEWTNEKLLKQNTARPQATNLTTPPAALIFALSHTSSANLTQAPWMTHSAFSDTYRAFTIIGKLGSLGCNFSPCPSNIPGCEY
jgi:hypothetical protein